MIHTTNINIAVDVIAALSDKSLAGNVYLMDDSSFESTNQGTDHLTTLCIPNQLIRWVVYAVDLQTPVSIKNITFLEHEGALEEAKRGAHAYSLAETLSNSNIEEVLPEAENSSTIESSKKSEIIEEEKADTRIEKEQDIITDLPAEEVKFGYDNLDRFDWSGYVPKDLNPGTEYHYRLELQMGEGEFSTLSIDTASLQRI